MNKNISFFIFAAFAALFSLSSCSDSKSYAELLQDENKAVNKFLVQHRVYDYFPEDSYEIGPDAPYYRIDDDRNVYMQVLDKGSDEKPAEGDKVYFRYVRYDISSYVVGSDDNVGSGNAVDMNTSPTFFLFKNTSISQSTQYGTGIQEPMNYLGYNAKVNLVIKSQAGPTDELSYVIPFLWTVSYYKPMM